MRIARNLYAIPCGKVLRIPEDLDEASAAAWLKAGLAEEDKMLDPVLEKKKKSHDKRR